MSKRILIHIGYHKTATTWMQKHLFLPHHGYQQIMTHQEVFDLIVRPHGLRFEADPARALIKDRLSEVAPDHVPVISSEILSGHPFQGGHESDVFAERLAQIAPGSRILITIRDQMRIIPSVYMQYLQRGGTMCYRQFLAGTSQPGYFGFTPEHFEYDVLLRHYQGLFGTESTYVSTQEALKQDMQAASTALAAFAEATRFTTLSDTANTIHASGYPEAASPALRRTNHLRKSTLNPRPMIAWDGLYTLVGGLSRRSPVKHIMACRHPISDYVQEHFKTRYTVHNQVLKTQVAHPIDLSTYC
ncbi:MAG: hypothetical protein AAGF56_07065 [Pseudomonadota bacterium]